MSGETEPVAASNNESRREREIERVRERERERGGGGAREIVSDQCEKIWLIDK